MKIFKNLEVFRQLYDSLAHAESNRSLLFKKMAYEGEFSDVIYKSLDSIMEVLNRPENKQLDSVKQLLATYERVSSEEIAKQVPSAKKYPLIVMEGLDGCGKSTATKRLSKTMNAELFGTPPTCMHDLRPLFDGEEYKKLRVVYYALGNYIAALQISTILSHKPVILDRFWHSTAAYAIAQAIQDYPERYSLPPADDNIYSWPQDLLSPDIIMFMSVSEHVRLKRLGSRTNMTTQENLLKSHEDFRKNVIQAYKRMYNPQLVIINAQQSKRKVEDEMLGHIHKLPTMKGELTG